MPAKKKADAAPEVEVTDAVSGEEIKPDDSPYANGEVSLGALRQGARDSDSVRRLQHALSRESPGAVRVTGNYGARTAALVAQAVGSGDGRHLTKAQASKILGKGITVND